MWASHRYQYLPQSDPDNPRGVGVTALEMQDACEAFAHCLLVASR
jgi:hypothetical protein